jgi:drug efflux transport system ATP-binding protein
VIEVSGLSRRFGERSAVDDLSFTVAEGELFGLVGPDGAGKTTTLRMLAGVLRPSGGDATIGGLSVAREPERVKHRIAYMSQRFGLYTDLTVAENLRFYADLYRVPRGERAARLERLYEFSGLEPFRDRLAGALSGGMKQKLGLSCALIHEPEVLLLDEPTFGVDPVSRRELWVIVHEMVASGVTAVVATAYLDEAERFDRLVLLDEGKRIALDDPVALQRSFEGEVIEVGVRDPYRGREAAAAVPGVRRATLFGDRLHLSVDSAERRSEAVVRALRDAGVEPGTPRAVPPSLEDVFIDRVTGARGARVDPAGEPAGA